MEISIDSWHWMKHLMSYANYGFKLNQSVKDHHNMSPAPYIHLYICKHWNNSKLANEISINYTYEVPRLKNIIIAVHPLEWSEKQHGFRKPYSVVDGIKMVNWIAYNFNDSVNVKHTFNSGNWDNWGNRHQQILAIVLICNEIDIILYFIRQSMAKICRTSATKPHAQMLPSRLMSNVGGPKQSRWPLLVKLIQSIQTLC